MKAKLCGAVTRTDSKKSGEGPLERENEVTDNNNTSGGKKEIIKYLTLLFPSFILALMFALIGSH